MKNTLFLALFLLILVSNSGIINAQNATQSPESVKKLIAKKRSYNKSVGFGYSIQIYNGNEVNAKSKKAKFGILFPGVATKLTYDSPEWKVHVGNYKTKLEADRANLIFKKDFSGVVVPMQK